MICAPWLAQAQSPGCMDPEACNYDQWASTDDGSCEEETHIFVPNSEATLGLPPYTWCGPLPDCSNMTVGCPIPAGFIPANPNCLEQILDMAPTCSESWTSTCLALYAECILGVPGCTNPMACNFNPDATFENSTCLFPGSPCDDSDPCTVDDSFNLDCECEGQPGDGDGDGLCGEEDCNDAESGLPVKKPCLSYSNAPLPHTNRTCPGPQLHPQHPCWDQLWCQVLEKQKPPLH